MRAWGQANQGRMQDSQRLAMRSRSRDAPVRDATRQRDGRTLQIVSQEQTSAEEANRVAIGNDGNESSGRARRGVLRGWSGEHASQLEDLPSSTRLGHDSHRHKRRYTGRERFEEGHDNRLGSNFDEYYTPRWRPYTHQERWEEGHDDRDGYTYNDHASSVRPFTDRKGFDRH